jgi:hypothetical protein
MSETETARGLVRDIARAAREIDPAVPLTADGDGFILLTARRCWGTDGGHSPDFARACGEGHDGDGWMVSASDQNQKMPDSHTMFLSDAHLRGDRQGHIDGAATAAASYARKAAALSGWEDTSHALPT